ncbi:hypothetical protein C8R43DRAFT_1122800 [Mycena crocata]|nr:hypothetical protein C8R43DRAFT_1122800 [Mycena crocata]
MATGVDIAKWPVQPEYKDHLMAISCREQAARRVGGNDRQVGSPRLREEWNSVDSFTAEIQQIVILRYGQAPPANVFCRAARPFRFGAVADLAAAAQPSATGPTPIAAVTPGIVLPRSNVVHAVGPAALNTTVAG